MTVYVCSCHEVFPTHQQGILHEKECEECQRIITGGIDQGLLDEMDIDKTTEQLTRRQRDRP